MANDLETGGHILKHFRDILAQRLELPAAVRATGCLRHVLDRFARQGFRERLALA
jgi:hypothetical protein